MLTHEESGLQARLCESCLEMSVRLQADAQNLDSDRVLDAYAQAADGQIWRTEHVRYVMPSRLDNRLLARDSIPLPGKGAGDRSAPRSSPLAPDDSDDDAGPSTGPAAGAPAKGGTKAGRTHPDGRRFEERVADQH